MRFATQNIKNRTLGGRIAMPYKFLVVRDRKKGRKKKHDFHIYNIFCRLKSKVKIIRIVASKPNRDSLIFVFDLY